MGDGKKFRQVAVRAGLNVVMVLQGAVGMAQTPGAAPSAPSASQMIEQLKVPRTRSLRNLAVEAAPENVSAPLASPPGTPEATAAAAAAAANASAAAIAAAAAAAAANASAAAIAAAAGTAQAAPTEPQRPSLSLLIQFDFNSAKVRPESHPALANLSQALQSAELAGSRFAVEGHTDAKGAAEYNRKLSEQRALAVRELLRLQGVSESRLLASGKGASELANAADPFAAENRRVRIVNLD